MSRQLYFFQVTQDVCDFLEYAEKMGAKLLLDGKIESPSSLNSTLMSENTSITKLYLIPESLENLSDPAWTDVFSGMAIEYKLCTKQRVSFDVYADGRVYLRQMRTGRYHEELQKLYNRLVNYIKKYYLRTEQHYYAPLFLEKHKSGQCCAVNGNTLLYFDDTCREKLAHREEAWKENRRTLFLEQACNSVLPFSLKKVQDSNTVTQ